jgi:hypothetical protein
MSESTTPEDHDPAAADEMRQHTQTDTEGGEASDPGEEMPREHTQDPAEG